MTNEEKFKTPEERLDAFDKFCESRECHKCELTKKTQKGILLCALRWLTLEAEEEKPLPCPFCGCSDTATLKANGRQAIQCMRCTATVFAETKADAIAAWNRRSK